VSESRKFGGMQQFWRACMSCVRIKKIWRHAAILEGMHVMCQNQEIL
jgi:hypothetical protein